MQFYPNDSGDLVQLLAIFHPHPKHIQTSSIVVVKGSPLFHSTFFPLARTGKSIATFSFGRIRTGTSLTCTLKGARISSGPCNRGTRAKNLHSHCSLWLRSALDMVIGSIECIGGICQRTSENANDTCCPLFFSVYAAPQSLQAWTKTGRLKME